MIEELRDFTRRNNNIDDKLLFFILSPGIIPHELIHYLTGKCLGLEIKMELAQHQVKYTYDYGWQNVLVTIMPTIFALLILLISIFLPHPASRIVYLYGVLSLLLCTIDILDLLVLLKKGGHS